MARTPKNDKKVFDQPLVVRNPGPPFYKAFMFDSEAPDMIVDISGDIFSHTVEDSIISLFDHMAQDLMMKIPNRTMWIGEEQVEYDNEATSQYMSRIVVLQLRANYDEEFTSHITDQGAHEFHLPVNTLKEGYVSGIQEYSINVIHLEAKNTADRFHLRSLNASVSDSDTANPIFPEVLEVSVS
jgi:hypothetical protein